MIPSSHKYQSGLQTSNAGKHMEPRPAINRTGSMAPSESNSSVKKQRSIAQQLDIDNANDALSRLSA